MKNTLKISMIALIMLGLCNSFKAQTTGDIAFTGFNTSGDDDFAIVALATIAANSTIYIKDNSGFIIWDTGASSIPAGKIITFKDVDSSSNPLLGVSVGTISKSGTFNWSSNGEAVFIYTGTDKDTPTTYITGMVNSKTATDLSGTGLTAGENFLQLSLFKSSDGGVFSKSRTNQTSYKSYLPLLVNPDNWDVDNSDGEVFLPFSEEAFTINTKPHESLGVTDVLLHNVKMYTTSNSLLRIEGVMEGKTMLEVYNILGQQVVQTSFNTKGQIDIPLPKLSKGVYIAKIENKLGSVCKKFILE